MQCKPRGRRQRAELLNPARGPLAVALSVGERGRAPCCRPTRPPKSPAFYGVLCSSRFWHFFGSCGSRWGQGPPGRGTAVRQFSPLRRREGPRPLPPTSPCRQKVPRFTVFCARPIFSTFSDLVARDGSRWANMGLEMGQHSPKMGQHSPQDGPT